VSELDPLDERLNRAWRALSPPVDLAARVRVRLASTGGAGATATLTEQVASRWRALRASGVLGAGAGALLLGAGIALGYLIPRQPADAAPAPERGAPAPAEARPLRASAPLSSAPVPPAAKGASASSSAAASPDRATPDSPAPVAPAPESPAAAPRARAHRAGPASITKDDPNAELVLLERAERAVRSRNPALALALIAELEHSFPRSPLHEERRSIELMAHCQARDASSGASADTKAETAARRARFLRQYPESVYSARITDECGDEHSVAPQTTPPTNGTTPDIDGVERGNDVQHD
jgi:hypothetical protein